MAPMALQRINPPDLPVPSTYTHVVVAPAGKLVFIAGQEPEDRNGNLVGRDDLAGLSQPGYLIEVDAFAVT